MVKFDPNFFEKEIRSGFEVPSMMKRAWAGEMKILSEIIQVCNKYDLTYYADYGTLLGAVRHNGFVPWDDDMDIAMKREDFNKLFEVLPKELPSTYGISSVFTEKDHNTPFGCVSNSRFLCRDDRRTKEFYGCPYVVGIDIYPLDCVPRDKEQESVQMELYTILYDAAQRFDELKQSGELYQYLPEMEEIFHVSLPINEELRHKLWLLCDKVSSLYKQEECDGYTLFLRRVVGDETFFLNKEWYASTIEMPFENMTISVPVGYHEILTQLYGDYKTPVFGQSAHEYPFYKSQKEILGIKDEDSLL